MTAVAHDNDTSLGWFATETTHGPASVQAYFKTDGGDAPMNLPGLAHGQWGPRCTWEQFKPWHAERLRVIPAANGRNGLALDLR